MEGKRSSLAIRRAVVDTTRNLSVKLFSNKALCTNKLEKAFSEFYNRRYELVSYFSVGLKTL